MKNYLAIIGGLIAAFSTVPYLIDIVRRKTKPNIVTWFTWTLLTAIATAAAFASNAPRAAILTLGSTICTGAVVALGIKYGFAKLSRFDVICQISAVTGLILWLIFNSPTIALIFSLGVDFVAALPTFHHSWIKPAEETWQTFIVGVSASVFTLLSLNKYAFADLAFPVYLGLSNAGITSTIIYRRSQKGLSLSR